MQTIYFPETRRKSPKGKIRIIRLPEHWKVAFKHMRTLHTAHSTTSELSCVRELEQQLNEDVKTQQVESGVDYETYASSYCWFLFCIVIPSKRSGSAINHAGRKGSSVPLPLYRRWAQEYNQRGPAVQMQYLPWEHRRIKQVSHSVGDFGAGERAD